MGKRTFVAWSAMILATACSGQTVESTFGTDLEGWQNLSDGVIGWSALGNPGGSARMLDQGVGGTYYFVAPAKFRGAKAAYFGGWLTWELNTDHDDGWGPSFADVELVGTAASLYLQLPRPTTNQWDGRAARLDTTFAWRVGSLSGPLASGPQIQSVLQNLVSLRLRGEYDSTSTPNTSFLDNVRLQPGPTRINGLATLEGYVGSTSGELLEVQVWQDGILVEVLDGHYGPDGTFAFSPTINGAATLKFRFRTGLWKAVPVTLGPTPIENLTVIMTNGDCDHDNEVGIGDYALLSSNYGLSIGDPGYDTNADLNGDATVDIADYAILSDSYGKVGD